MDLYIYLNSCVWTTLKGVLNNQKVQQNFFVKLVTDKFSAHKEWRTFEGVLTE